MLKKIVDPLDISYRLEMEVSRRLKDCDQVYRVLAPELSRCGTSVVSEYVEGKDLTEAIPELSEPQLLSVVCQTLMLIYRLNVAGVSHNDLHCSNIRVQPTPQHAIDYFCRGRTYTIPTHGIKVVIIDFGGALIMDGDVPMRATSSLFIADSFMRLDVRYDTFRFLKSFVDTIQWRTDGTKCRALMRMVDDKITRPLALGIYGIQEWAPHLAPRLFNKSLRHQHPNAPLIADTLLSLIDMWPEHVPSPSAQELQMALDAVTMFNTLGLTGARELTTFVIYGAPATSLTRRVAPLASVWRTFKHEYKQLAMRKFTIPFSTETIVQDPVAVVDWIIVAALA